MREFESIKNLAGEEFAGEAMKRFDCYACPQMGLFIPIAGTYGETSGTEHSHPAYMIIIYFEESTDKQLHCRAEITSPGVVHKNRTDFHYYCLMISGEFFESRYRMYDNEVPSFKEYSFPLCRDILKALNTFAFEYSKSMMNSEIVLGAQSEIITHWVIRSLLGENLDMRAVSDDYSVARAQHYMERHYGENITVSQLAGLGYISPSALNRKFRQEIGMTPIDYLIEIRIERAKILLRRKSISMTEISMLCGFGSSSHFSSCFQNRIGMTPTEYRNKFID